MSRLAPTGVSAVRPRVTSELSSNTNRKTEDRGRSRPSDVSRVPEIPNIQHLRSRFQPNDTPRTAPASLGHRATTTGSSGVPEIRLNAAAEQPSSRKRTSPEDPIDMDDPEKYFESTNHTQRFQQTRALFAKMEEQTRLDQERRRQSLTISRSKSPTRFPVSSRASLVISPAVGSGDAKIAEHSPTKTSDPDHRSPATKITRYGMREPREERPRVLSASTDIREVKPVETPLPLDRDRSSSVDRLDVDEPSSLRDSSKSFSRSETDLGRSVRESMPSATARQLLQHYEDVVRKNAALFGGQVQRRRTRPTENHIHSGPDSLQKDEHNKPSSDDRKLSSSGSPSDTKIIPSGSAFVQQKHTDRSSASSKVPPTSSSVNSRYGRVEEPPPISAKPVQSVVSNTDQPSRPSGRRTADMDVEDNGVVKSIEAWKNRRRSNKSDDPEKENAHQTSDGKPTEVTDRYLSAINSTETGQNTRKENFRSESTNPAVSEQSSIFGVALRSTSTASSKSEDEEVKPRTELETEVPLTSALSAPDAEVNLHREPVNTERQSLTDTSPADDVGNNRNVDVNTSDLSERRTSVELAEVPHFPKDSLLLSGGHLSTSPRSSFDGSHHLPASLPDQKPDDNVEDSVFTKDHTQTDRSIPQPNDSSVPSASSTSETGGVEMLPSVDFLIQSETSQ